MSESTRKTTFRRLLISGGAGYLATNLINRLAGSGCEMIRLDREGVVFPPLSSDETTVRDVVGDVRDRALWEHILENVDVVFHFAAQTSVYTANRDPAADLEANVIPVLHLLDACRSRQLRPTILFAGTATQCGIPAYLPVDEDQPDRPVTIYDIHKLTDEGYLKHYAGEGSIRAVTLRLANVYGPGPASGSADRGVLNSMIRKALQGETLTIHGTGEHVRDYVFVEDVAQAFLAAAAHADELNGRHFVIGTGRGCTIAGAIRTVADRVTRRTGKDVRITHVDPPGPQSPIEGRNFVADSTRFTQLTGWRPTVDLVQGIDRTIETYLTTESGTS